MKTQSQEPPSQDIDFGLNKGHVYIFLQLVKNRKDIVTLLKEGFNYTQIAIILGKLANAGLIETTQEKGLTLTELGNNILVDFYKNKRKQHNGSWLEPLNEKRIEQKGIFDVVLPKRRKFRP